MSFIDTSRDEVLLRFQIDAQGLPLIGFTLYDAAGVLVADAPEPQAYPDGVTIKAPDEEVLFAVMPDEPATVTYRLYNHKGTLLTESDGTRTQIYGYLRMDGNKIGANRTKPQAQTPSA
jgi:hypothetical protein